MKKQVSASVLVLRCVACVLGLATVALGVSGMASADFSPLMLPLMIANMVVLAAIQQKPSARRT